MNSNLQPHKKFHSFGVGVCVRLFLDASLANCIYYSTETFEKVRKIVPLFLPLIELSYCSFSNLAKTSSFFSYFLEALNFFVLEFFFQTVKKPGLRVHNTQGC